MMSPDLAAYLFSTLTVVVAEMGDKTQLLAMAFALKFKWWKVMIGVVVATVLNHALAVALGAVLGRIQAAHAVIQILAAASFIGFGLWTLKGDELGDETKASSRFGPIVTVGVAFFLAEIGDKTQFATIALAAKYPVAPLWVLLGTTSGMAVADGFGIVVGVVLCRKIPERIIKLLSAVAFTIFGLASTFELFREEAGLSLGAALACLAGLTVVTAGLGLWIYRKYPSVPAIPGLEAACVDKDPEVAEGEALTRS